MPVFYHQEETETVHDYIVMYQHQRQQQKLRIQVIFFSYF
jgi:hypothetical protein